jgi:hypothetical protein
MVFDYWQMFPVPACVFLEFAYFRRSTWGGRRICDKNFEYWYKFHILASTHIYVHPLTSLFCGQWIVIILDDIVGKWIRPYEITPPYINNQRIFGGFSFISYGNNIPYSLVQFQSKKKMDFTCFILCFQLATIVASICSEFLKLLILFNSLV